jgi:hypothetical protein
MPFAHNPPLIAVELLASSVWVGSLVCLAVVASAARSSLDPAERVAFFRALGRRYGAVGGGALTVAIGTGFVMIWPPSSWGLRHEALAALAVALVVVTGVGVRQASAMTTLRRRSIDQLADRQLAEQVRRGARWAAGLRSLIGAITLGLLGLAASLIAK